MTEYYLNTSRKKYGLKYSRNLAILFLFMFCLLFVVLCERDNSALSKKEKDEGILETVERGPAILTLEVDRKEISIAERLNLTIGITVNEDYEIKLPGFGDKLEQFGIVDYHTTRPELVEDNRIKTSRSYVLEPFLSGDYIIPPMVIRFWKKGEQETGSHEIETPEVVIKVKSLLPEDLEEAKLNEIKPPVPFPRTYEVLLWSGLGAVIILITIVFISIVKRRKSGENGSGNIIPAHELAYMELEKLINEDLINKGEIKLFYQRISWIIRCYIESRFGLHAPEQTTEEFLTGLEFARDFPGDYKTLLRTFLKHCDLVKFAEHRPETEDIQNTFDSCKAFIEGTAIQTLA